jgi:predicted dithiol-disulfide oxidoreductase (DUF899 family)
MVAMPDCTLEGEQGPVRLADVFGGKSQLIVYSHMWFPGEEWQCPGCTGFTAQFTRLEFLDSYDARFVMVTQGPTDEALAYKRRVGNKMTWHTNGRGTEQLTHTFAPVDLLPYGRQEEWQDSPEGWPQAPTYSGWGGSQRVAVRYGPDA